MAILTTQNLSKFYGPDEIFRDVTVEIPHGGRVALVGPNGAGKTTLLNILAGLDSATDGRVNIARSQRIGFLPQRPELVGDHSLWQEALTAFDDLRQMETQLNQLEHDMADADKHESALAVYGTLQSEFERRGGYVYEAKIRMVLNGVGFATEDFDMPLPQLSGGQKTRALLARLLLSEPGLLLLDEPTNHLDIDAVEWLESYLKGFAGAVLVVSHDRYFMDNFAQIIWEMDWGTVETYRGNYSHYVRQREARHERTAKEYESQREFIAKEEAFIRKHMGSRLTAQAKGRQKKLETMRKRGKIIDRPRAAKRDMNLKLQAAMRSGDKVLWTRDLSVGYTADAPLFHVPDITLWRGETAALIGGNGVGKSTFLKTVIEQLTPLSGRVRLGASVKVGYFAQAHEKLNADNTLIDEVTMVKPMPLSEARSYLGQYLFSGEDVFRTVATLSGGERGRLALAKLALSGANLLLLDEPTNHLDIESQEVLQDVLADFGGTVLIVSHDRYLIDALATQIWHAQAGEMAVFEGTYREFISKRDAAAPQPQDNGHRPAAESAAKKSDSRPAHGLTPYQLKKRVAEVEARIQTLETQISELEARIATASAEGDAGAVHQLGAEYAALQESLEGAIDEWGGLIE
ncbi:MAG: ABC transporter ATP-binding protein [Anaerolineaceae bacterium]|nr:MAG: ABC transporter ATP-binding protein [Anaerolineaceae bacterium]